MECNRDEALRSKVIAEAKFLQRDLGGAKKFAQKAKQLYPDLDGIAQFIYVLDVHIAAQDKLQTGERNWYGILEADPSADESTIRKQYRRLALLLHPDKNKAVGAEAAFKHISEAWMILSDKNKKAAYDARRQSKMPPHGGRQPQQNNAPNSSSKPAAPNEPSIATPCQRQSQEEPFQPPPPHPEPAEAPVRRRPFSSAASMQPILNTLSFWTACPSCRMLLEYQRVYLQKNLCCPLCFTAFTAIEVSAVRGTLLWPLPPQQHGYRVDAFTNGFMPNMGANDNLLASHFESFPFGKAKIQHLATSDMTWAKKQEKTFGNAMAGHSSHASTTYNSQQDKQEEADGGCAIPHKLTPQLHERVEEGILNVQQMLNTKPKKIFSKPKQKATKKSIKETLKAQKVAEDKEAAKFLITKLKGVIEQRLSVEKERKMKGYSADLPKAKTGPLQTDDLCGMNDNIKADRVSETNLDNAEVSQKTTEASPHFTIQELPDFLPKAKTGPLQIDDLCGMNDNLKADRGSETNLDNAEVSQNTTEASPHFTIQELPDLKRPATALQQDKAHIFPPFKKAKMDEVSPLNGIKLQKDAQACLDKIEDTVQAKESSEGIQPLNSGGKSSSADASSHLHSSFEENTECVRQATPLDSDVPMWVKGTITVPHLQSYDFDKIRLEDHFLPGQVWAAYDDDDSMPRYYARINKVISFQPFKLQIAWLEARSTSDETLAWLDSGFPLTCGEFRIGKSISSDRANMFSHIIKFERGQRNSFIIYPREGEIWALYKNWQNLVAKDRKSEFLVVEVLTDFHEKEGVQVCHLEKRSGYKTLFQRRSGQEYSEWIHTSEMRRFSHQIPAYHNKQLAFKGNLWELDPAATPLDLIT